MSRVGSLVKRQGQLQTLWSIKNNKICQAYYCSLILKRRSIVLIETLCNISTTSARVLSGVPNTEKQMKARGRFGRVLLLFRGVWNA